MGNSPSSFATARKGLTVGDASSISEEVWSDLWGSDGSQPPLGPGDMLNFLTDATLRKLRAERPMNLAALVARAVCRLEELIAPDVGKESFGAVVVPKDACLLLTPLRVLTRAIPFAIGSRGCDDDDVAVRVLEDLLWGHYSEIFQCPRPAPTWRGHVALAPPPSRAAEPAERPPRRDPTLGERIASLALDLLFLPGFTTRFDPNDALTGERRVWDAPTGREYAPPYDAYVDVTRHRTEVTRLWLALVGAEALCAEPRTRPNGRFSALLAGRGCPVGVPCSRPVSHRDVHGALTDAIKSQSGSAKSLDGSAAGELLAVAYHTYTALLEYDDSAPNEEPTDELNGSSTPPTHHGVGRKTQNPNLPAGGAGGRTRKGGVFGWLDDFFGGFFIPYDPIAEAAASSCVANGNRVGTASEHAAVVGDTAAADGPRGSGTRNAYATILAETRSESELEGLHQALLRTLRSAIDHPSGSSESSLMSYVPAVGFSDGVVKVRARFALEGEERDRAPAQEAAILAMRLLRSDDDGFFQHVTDPKFKAGVPLASSLLQIMYQKRLDVNAGGFNQCASFVLLRLSSSPAFASALNDVLPPAAAAKLNLPTDGGARTHTHADSLIHAVHAILCERAEYAEYVAPLVDPLLTTLRNAAPRWRGLGDVGAAKLLRLCEHFSSPPVLFLAERNRHDLGAVVHAIDGCLSHGAGRNPRLVLELCRGDGAAALDRVDEICAGRFRSPRPALDRVSMSRLNGGFKRAGLGDDAPEFIPAATFAGARPGYFFRVDARGAGYYVDRGMRAFVARSDDDGSSSDGDGSDNDSDDSYSDDSGSYSGSGSGSDSGSLAAFGVNVFRPDDAWLGAVRSDIAPALFAARTLRRELADALAAYEEGHGADADALVEHLASLELANLLPPPPPVTVRHFASNAPEIRKWLKGYAMGVALVRHNAGPSARACGILFDASRVRLVRVATSAVVHEEDFFGGGG